MPIDPPVERFFYLPVDSSRKAFSSRRGSWRFKTAYTESDPYSSLRAAASTNWRF